MGVRRGKDAERVAIYWGKATVKVNGKATSINLVGYTQREIFTKLKVKPSKVDGSVSFVDKNSKGHRIIKGTKKSIGGKYVLVSFGTKKTYKRRGATISVEEYYRVRVPSRTSRAQIFNTLSAGGAVKKFKYPNGEVVVIANS